MKRTEVDKIFTSKVMEFISDGYIIDTNLSNGSQGEISKVVMRKENDVIIVLMENLSHAFHSHLFEHGITIKIGRYNKLLNSKSVFDIAWLNEFNYFEATNYISLNHYRKSRLLDEWFVTEEEYTALKARAYAHREADGIKSETKIAIISKVPNTVLSHVNSIRGYKRVKASDIKIEKIVDRLEYRIYVNNKFVYHKNII